VAVVETGMSMRNDIRSPDFRPRVVVTKENLRRNSRFARRKNNRVVHLKSAGWPRMDVVTDAVVVS
jgi:hypothetical protein